MIDPIDSHLARRLRELRRARGLTGDDMAVAARSCGLTWTRPTCSKIESGARRLLAAELLTLPAVFAAATAERSGSDAPPVTLDDLLDPHPPMPAPQPVPVTEAERKAAARLGVDTPTLARLCDDLWGRSFLAERDHRVAALPVPPPSPRSLQAARGHATRTMLTDLAAAR